MSAHLGTLTLVCSKCTREQQILCIDRNAGDIEAWRLGWVFNADKSICPKCPAVRTRAPRRAA